MAAEEIAEKSVAFVNSKNLGDQPSFYAGLSMRGAVEAANAFSALMVTTASKAAKHMLAEDPTEALSVQKLFSDGVAAQLNQLGASVAGLQGLMKGVQTIPPVTSPQPVVAGS